MTHGFELTYTMASSTTNLLDKVVDNVTATASTYTNDLDETQTTGNYAYDAIGNLTKDVAAGIAANGIVWTPYGKIKQVTNATYRIEYLYDAMGNRVRQKRVKLSDNSHVTTYYGRDASGKNVVGTYEKIGTGSTVLKEVPLYGSSRLGILRPNATQSTTAITPPTIYTRSLGKKEYELTDHLGNVRVSVSDRLVKPGADWRNDVKTQTDYFPFGMQREDRNDNVAGYRYGYNGKENDNDVKGEGNQQDYGFRIYDPRVARFLSVDPLTAEYPAISPYGYANNSPIKLADYEGGLGIADDLINYAKRQGIAFLKKTAADIVKAGIQTTVDVAKYKVEKYLDENVNSDGSIRTSLALTAEFMTGLGPEERRFGPNHPFTISLKESNMTTEALKAFYKGYKKHLEGGRDDVPERYRVDFGYLFAGETGPVKEFLKDVKFSAAQFLGTADYQFSLSADRKTLRIHVEDTKTEYSLLYHAPGTDRHKRYENRVMGETQQSYDFSVTMDEVKRRSGDKNDK